FEWGAIKWLISPANVPETGLTFGEVVMQPGEGHGRHNHPDAEEVLFVLSGVGEQMVNDEEPFPVGAGDTIYVPTGVYHSTVNTGWSPMRVLAIYNPAGPEKVLSELPDHRTLKPGEVPEWVRR
ncbi:MAG: cupin domain-containing protein, partial [Actinomycetota bacterium]